MENLEGYAGALGCRPDRRPRSHVTGASGGGSVRPV